MKKLLLILFSFLTFFSGKSQTPSFNWAKALHGANYAFGMSCAVDKYGNVYSTGILSGANTVDMDPGPGTYTLSSGNGFYVLKLDPMGNFLWAVALEGFCRSIAVDSASNPYLTGFFNLMVDFDPGPGTFTLNTLGGQDIFVLKLSAQGNFLWAKHLGQGNSTNDDCFNVVVDRFSNVVVAGTISDDILIAKFNNAGNPLWSRQIGSTGQSMWDTAWGLCVDSIGSVYTTGYFNSIVDFDPGPSVSTLSVLGASTDGFVLKLDTSGNFVWVKQFGGAWSDLGQSISVDASGDVIVTGDLYGTGDYDPGPGTFTLGLTGVKDIFVMKLNALGGFMWAKKIGTFGAWIQSQGLKTAGDNDIYMTGVFNNIVDFDPSPLTSYSLTSFGDLDVFILKLTGSGYLAWARQVGGYGEEITYSLDLGNSGGIYLTGSYEQTCDFDPGTGFYNVTVTGSKEPFVLKLLECSVGLPPTVSNNGAICAGTSATINVSGAVTYTWSNGATGSSLVVSPSVTTVYTVQATNVDACVNSATFTQVVNLCVGIKNVSADSFQPTIYPNPNKGSFILTGIPLATYNHYELMDAWGHILDKTTVENKNEDILFNLHDKEQKPGIYFIRLTAPSKSTTVKFVIE